MRLSPDPVIQWCLEEALGRRLRAERARAEEREVAVARAHEQAQRQLRAATA